jgi:hypothetical protein
MPKPKAPEWLRLAFRDGVDEREALTAIEVEPYYYGCWLAQFDTEERPCTDKLERMHVIGRQRVENALGALLKPCEMCNDHGVIAVSIQGIDSHGEVSGDYINATCPECLGISASTTVLLAAWDPRNGKIACEGHHRRFDSHATPALVVPADSYPEHVLEFAEDYGLEHCLPEYAIREEAA